MDRPATIACARCGRRVSPEAPHCPQCGADPRTGAPSHASRGFDRARVCQGVGIRLAAQAIDTALLFLVFILLGYAVYLLMVALGSFSTVGKEPSSAPLWIVFGVGSFLYYWLGEGIWGTTLGKRFCDLRVLRLDGSHIGLGAALVRTVLRPVDFLPAAYLLGAVLVWVTARDQRLGDLAARTVVVRTRTLETDQLDGPRVVPWVRNAKK